MRLLIEQGVRTRARRAWSRPFAGLAALGLLSLTAYVSEAAVTPAIAHAAVQTTLYASPTGSGATCSQSSPCSLSGARSAVEGMDGSMSGDIVVYLLGGTYRLSSTFALGPQDSGTNGHTVYHVVVAQPSVPASVPRPTAKRESAVTIAADPDGVAESA